MKKARTDAALEQLAAEQPGLDLLRVLAGYPHRSVQLARHQVKSRVLVTQRDQFGKVLGSTERAEESEFIDLEGQWLD